jgi:hypothetical protein
MATKGKQPFRWSSKAKLLKPNRQGDAPAAGEGGEGQPRQLLGLLCWNRIGGKLENLLNR